MRKLHLAVMVVGLGATVMLGRRSSAGEQPRPHAEDKQQAEAAVAAVERQWLDALERGDTAAIAAILADDFVRPAPQAGRFINKAELLAYYRRHLVPETTQHKHIQDLTVSVYGATAIARGKLVTTNSAGRTTSVLLFTDVFMRRNGRWLAVSAQEDAVPQP